jgi:hypothetical protein
MMISREEYQRLVDEYWEALEEERKANTDDACAKAQAHIIEAEAAILRATGSTDRRRRRMAVDALDLPPGTRVEAGEFERILKQCLDTVETRASRNKLRRLLSRHFLDNEETFTIFVRLLVDKLFKNQKGLFGVLDLVEGTSGVDPTKGLDGDIRTIVVAAAGYSAGVEFGLNKDIPFTFWKRAHRRHSHEADRGRARGEKIATAKAETIRDWCVRVAGPHAENFREVRAAGFAERNNPDPSRGIDYRGGG